MTTPLTIVNENWLGSLLGSSVQPGGVAPALQRHLRIFFKLFSRDLRSGSADENVIFFLPITYLNNIFLLLLLYLAIVSPSCHIL